MTKERGITVLILIGTLVVGVCIGLLVPGFFHKYREDKMRGRGGSDRDGDSKREWFAYTINKVIKPDSIQSKKIKAITDWASEKIEAVEISSNERMSSILDSVKIQLQPILTEDQQKRFTEFQGRAHGKWKNRGDRRH